MGVRIPDRLPSLSDEVRERDALRAEVFGVVPLIPYIPAEALPPNLDKVAVGVDYATGCDRTVYQMHIGPNRVRDLTPEESILWLKTQSESRSERDGMRLKFVETDYTG